MENNQKELTLLEDLGMLYPKETSNYKKRYGLYKCFCGNEFKSLSNEIKRKNIKSCGCLRKSLTINKITGIGNSNHDLYNTWNTMIHRCYNPKRWDYKYYGILGIKVCDEWLNFENFINDMYLSYQKGLTLDRIDTNGNYFKDNCRWVNKSIQQRNKKVIQSNNTSGYKGVYKTEEKFKSGIAINSKHINIGTFNTAIEAAKAYNKYVIDNNLEHKLNLIKEE